MRGKVAFVAFIASVLSLLPTPAFAALDWAVEDNCGHGSNPWFEQGGPATYWRQGGPPGGFCLGQGALGCFSYTNTTAASFPTNYGIWYLSTGVEQTDEDPSNEVKSAFRGQYFADTFIGCDFHFQSRSAKYQRWAEGHHMTSPSEVYDVNQNTHCDELVRLTSYNADTTGADYFNGFKGGFIELDDNSGYGGDWQGYDYLKWTWCSTCD